MNIESIVEQSRTRLAIAGDCRMADVPALDAALRALLAASPAAVAIDFGDAGGLDIGPAWLLRRAIADLERRGTRAYLRLECEILTTGLGVGVGEDPRLSAR